MQSPNPLIALGISTFVAVNAIAAAANAEPSMRQRSTSATRETQTSSTQSSPQTTAQQQPSDAQQRAADRLDQLQTESQIRQQLNQSRFEPSNRPLTTESNALQLDQQIQQQLSTQDLQNLQQGVGTSPSRSLDRLQFEQRVRQQLQQPGDQPQSQASAFRTEAVESEAVEEAAETEAVETEAAKPEAAETEAVETEAVETEAAKPEANSAETTQTTAQAATNTTQVNTTRTEATQTEATQTEATQTEAAQTEAAQTAQTSVEPAPTEQSTTEQKPVDEPKRRNRRARRHTSEQQAQTEATPRPETPQAETNSEPDRAMTAEVDRPVSPTETEANSQASDAKSPAEPTEAPETTETPQTSEAPESAAADEVTETNKADESKAEETAETAEAPPATEAAEAETSKADEAETPEPEQQDRTETAQTPSGSSNPAPGPGNSQRIDFDTFSLNNLPAPEYLDPSPNPLFLPTQPDEVELAGTQPITLKQAVELAIRNNPALQQQRLTLERTQADLRNVEAANFPTLDALANFTQTGQQTIIEAPDTLGVNPVTGEDVPNPNAGEVDREYQDSTVLGTGLELNYNIFTSGRRSSLVKAAQGQVRLQQLEIERQTEQLILETIGNYYDLQQAGAQVNIFRANLTQAEQSLRDAQALERAGVGTRFDVLQADVDVANARQRLTQQLSDLEVARRQLAQQLNISQSLNISAADPIEVAGVWDLSLDESIVQGYKNRAELEQQLIQREIAQNNRRAALAQLGPQVGLNGTFNVVNNLDQDAGFTYNYQVALQASLSLFDGGAARAQANREESNIAIADSQFEATRDQIRFDIERGYSQLNASFTNIQTTALAVEQAAEALRLARLRFQAGVGTQTDVLRQQSVLAEAQVNNLSAILDYNRALAVLQRGVSNFPEGYLNDQP